MDAFRTPSANLPEPPGAEPYRIGPVLLGVAVGVVGAHLAFAALLMAHSPDLEHPSHHDLERYLQILSHLDFIALACSSLFSLIGGLIAAKLAGSRTGFQPAS